MTNARKRVELSFEVPFTHPSWVLEDEKVPISAVQDDASTVIASLWRLWAKRTGRAVSVRRDLALRWDEEHPRIGVDPDVCLLEPPPVTPAAELRSLRTWVENDVPPKVACEVVSKDNAEKDYGVGPRKYAAAGVQELWVFDPQRFGPDDDGGPWLLQLWERSKAGRFRRVYAGDGPAWSEYFRAWLVVSDDGLTLRLCDHEDGRGQWPTEAEEAEEVRADAEQARTDAEQARTDAERARTDAERARTDAERARTDAERARTDAEQARTDAEQARTDAEQARTDAERAQAEAAALQKKLAALEAQLAAAGLPPGTDPSR